MVMDIIIIKAHMQENAAKGGFFFLFYVGFKIVGFTSRPWRIMLIFSLNYAFRIAEKIAKLCYFYAKSYHNYAALCSHMLLMYDGSVQNNCGIFL